MRSAVILCALALLPFLPSLFRGSVVTFRDHGDYFLPLRDFTATALRHGEMPFWNPFNGSGERWLANPQTGIFYPPAWLFVVLPLPIAYSLFLAFHIALLGIGAFRLFSRYASEQASLIATVALLFSGPLLSLLDVNNNLASLSWLPWIVAAAIAIRRDDASPLARAPLLLALSFFAGEPIYAAVAALLFAGILLSKGKIRELAICAIGAAALTAAELVPFIDALHGSDRASGLPLPLALKESTTASDWLATIVPSVGSTEHLVWPHLSELFVRTVYIGPLIVVAFVAAWFARQRRLVFTLAGFAVVCAVFSAAGNVPLLVRLYPLLHLNVFRYPSRLLPLAFFAIAWVAAIGIDRLASAPRRAVVAIAVALAAGSAAAFLTFDQPPLVAAVVAAIDVVLTIAVIAQFSKRGIEWRTTLLVVVWIAADLLGAGRFYFQSSPAKTLGTVPFQIRKTEKIARYQVGRDRLATDMATREAWLPGYSNLFLRQFDAETPAPVIDVRYDQLLSDAIRRPRFDVLDLISVRFLLTSVAVPSHDAKLVSSAGNVHLYERRNAFPDATVWPAALFVQDAASGLAAVQRFPDARRQIAVSPPPDAVPNSASQVPHIFAANAAFVSLNRVEIDSIAPAAGIVMLNQAAASGWRVSVDGRPARPLTADGIFRAVAVPAGKHHVVWEYEPPFFAAAALVSAIALLLDALFLYLRK